VTRVARSLLVLVLLATGAELAVRVARHGWTRAALGAWSPAPAWERLRRLGPDGAPEPLPGGRAAWALMAGEPVVEYRLDGLGLRDAREFGVAPAPGTCRILAIGDAYTFGYGVAARDAYPARLERRLARHGRFEVINAGFPNLNVEQQRRRLATLLPRLHPRVVVATFDWWNVPLEERSAPRPSRWSRRWIVANVEEKGARLGEHVALVHAALGAARRTLTPALFPPSGLARELEPLTLPPEALADRWARTRTALAGMAADARTAGARFAVVVTPLDVQVDPARNALYRDGTLPYPSHGFQDVDYRRARAMPDALRAFAAAADVTLLDLTPAFEAAGGARLFLARDYHLAPPGHRVIARAVERWVLRSGGCGTRA
jgi:lysophospholipase L1-like esterase